MAQNYEIKEHIATIRTNDKGETLEINRMSWYGREPKIDIRYIDHESGKVGKGLTLTDREYEEFVKFFKEM